LYEADFASHVLIQQKPVYRLFMEKQYCTISYNNQES